MPFVERVRADGLVSGKFASSKTVLALNYCAKLQRCLLPLAVETHVRISDIDAALRWLENGAYVFGVSVAKPIMEHLIPELT